jgi:hypothetical protein
MSHLEGLAETALAPRFKNAFLNILSALSV